MARNGCPDPFGDNPQLERRGLEQAVATGLGGFFFFFFARARNGKKIFFWGGGEKKILTPRVFFPGFPGETMCPKFPLDEPTAEAKASAGIGLGVPVCGRAAAGGLRYGSDEAAEGRPKPGSSRLQRAAYFASVDLAKRKGAFRCSLADAYLASGTNAQMDEMNVRDASLKTASRTRF